MEELKDPEIVFGLVGAVGTELDKIIRIITDKLKIFNAVIWKSPVEYVR